MSKRGPKIDPRLLTTLSESGVPHSIARGSRHWKVCVAGKLAAVIPYDWSIDGGRNAKNAIATIKRAIREAST